MGQSVRSRWLRVDGVPAHSRATHVPPSAQAQLSVPGVHAAVEFCALANHGQMHRSKITLSSISEVKF